MAPKAYQVPGVPPDVQIQPALPPGVGAVFHTMLPVVYVPPPGAEVPEVVEGMLLIT